MTRLSHRVQFRHSILCATAVLAAASRLALAQPVPDYDFQWATITHPGNRPANTTEAPFLFQYPAPGRVDHEYRIARTEVTVAQWFEFVQAYTPYYEGPRLGTEFTSLSIVPTSTDPSQPPGYRIVNGHASRPASMSWRYAARYVNWLNNDKRPEREAFEQGVYDTTTFTQNPDGSYNDQLAHSPDVKFWIPSVDEWTKAVYFDLNRYGQGQEGYWMHPLRSDTPAISGPPGIGQTSAGPNGVSYLDVDVGSYPDSLTPWGLLDATGGVQEWTETSSDPNGVRVRRYLRGSLADDNFYDFEDRLDEYWLYYGGGEFSNAGYGLRVAGVVPTPPTILVAIGCLCLTSGRRRRR